MLIDFVPVTEGLTEQEVGQRIQTGWVYFGRQAVNVRSGIIDPTRPLAPTGLLDMDIWVLPQPTIPVNVVVGALVKTHIEQKDPTLALDDLARLLFGQGIVPLVERVTADGPPPGLSSDGVGGNHDQEEGDQH